MKGRDVVLFVVLTVLFWFGARAVMQAAETPVVITDEMVLLLAGIFTIIAVVRDQKEIEG